MAIASILVAAVIVLLTVGAAYATFRGAGNACASCGGNCGCGKSGANPINVSFDTKQ